MENKLIGAIAIVALVVSIVSWSHSAQSLGAVTTAAGPNIENYIPTIMYNNGYVSAKDISTTANLNAAAATFSSTLQVTGATTFSSTFTQTNTNAATSTASLGCIQTTATSTLTPVKLTIIGAGLPAGTATSSFGATGSGLVAWSFGVCP